MPKDALDSFSGDVASNYVDDAYKLMLDGNALHKMDGAISKELLENTISQELKGSLKKL